MAIEAPATAETGEQQARQGLGGLAGRLAQQLARFLPGGIGIPELELHLLTHTHPFAHRHGAVAGINADQVAHQEGRGLVGTGLQAEVAAGNSEKQGVLHLLPLGWIEATKDGLQGLHRASTPLPLAHLQHHIALGLLHLQHRSDRPAALGHHRLKTPGAADQAAHRAGSHPIAAEQGAMGSAVLAGNPTHLGHSGEGVIEAADQIVHRAAARIHQQQHPVDALQAVAHRRAPRFGGTVEVGEIGRIQAEGMEFRPGEMEQGEAEGGFVLQLMGSAARFGAHHTAAQAADPVAGLQLLAQQRQQARQVAGVARRGEHQGQIRGAGACQLAGQIVHRRLQGRVTGEGGATPGAALTPRQPGEGGKATIAGP